MLLSLMVTASILNTWWKSAAPRETPVYTVYARAALGAVLGCSRDGTAAPLYYGLQYLPLLKAPVKSHPYGGYLGPRFPLALGILRQPVKKLSVLVTFLWIVSQRMDL